MTSETVPWMLSDAVGAYSGKISCCTPLVRKPAGIINLVLSPIPSSAKTSGYIDLLLSPIPSSAKTSGYIDLLLSPIPSSAKTSGYIDLLLSPIPSPTQIHKNTDRLLFWPPVSIWFINIYFINGLLQPVCLHVLELLQH